MLVCQMQSTTTAILPPPLAHSK